MRVNWTPALPTNTDPAVNTTLIHTLMSPDSPEKAFGMPSRRPDALSPDFGGPHESDHTSGGEAMTAPVTASQAGLGSAHGKAILMGEHAVVYGAPAIALPLLDLQAAASVREADVATITSDLYTGPIAHAPAIMDPVIRAGQAAAERADLRADRLEVIVRSTIPFERGLGSSAAVSAAIVRAVANAGGVRLSPAETHALVQEAEHIAHGTSSGLDGHAVQSLVPLRFQAGKPTTVKVADRMTFVIADTGTSGSTSAAVNGVRMMRAVQPNLVDKVIDEIAVLVDDSADALAVGDAPRLGQNMHATHQQLARLGVSSPALDALVAVAVEAGAYGAKLTGSGLGGCVLALAPSLEVAGDLAAAMTSVGATRVWTTSLVPTTPTTHTAPTARVAPTRSAQPARSAETPQEAP